MFVSFRSTWTTTNVGPLGALVGRFSINLSRTFDYSAVLGGGVEISLVVAQGQACDGQLVCVVAKPLDAGLCRYSRQLHCTQPHKLHGPHHYTFPTIGTNGVASHSNVT
jgi:hypothetical protein